MYRNHHPHFAGRQAPGGNNNNHNSNNTRGSLPIHNLSNGHSGAASPASPARQQCPAPTIDKYERFENWLRDNGGKFELVRGMPVCGFVSLVDFEMACFLVGLWWMEIFFFFCTSSPHFVCFPVVAFPCLSFVFNIHVLLHSWNSGNTIVPRGRESSRVTPLVEAIPATYLDWPPKKRKRLEVYPIRSSMTGLPLLWHHH